MKQIKNIPQETLEIILSQINRQKLSNLSHQKIIVSLSHYDLSSNELDFIMNNFFELKSKYLKSYPKNLKKTKSYKSKVQKKVEQLISKGYSKEYALSQAEKEFKTDKFIKINMFEGGKTNKR